MPEPTRAIIEDILDLSLALKEIVLQTQILPEKRSDCKGGAITEESPRNPRYAPRAEKK